MFDKAFQANFAKAALAAAVTAAVIALPVKAQPRRVQVGQLACSQRNVACNFLPDGGPPEAYTGTITKVGLDVGFTTGGAMVWGVFADTNRYAGMLAGTYVGAQAEATVAAGLGANVLVGGSNRSIALQPLSVQGQTGLNVAAGVGALELKYAQ